MTQKTSNQPKKLWLVLLAVLLIGGGVAAGFLVVKKLSNSSNPTVVSSSQPQSNKRSHKPVANEKNTPEDSNQSAPKPESKTDQKSATKPDSKVNDQKAPDRKDENKTKSGSKPTANSDSTPNSTPNSPRNSTPNPPTPQPTKPSQPNPTPSNPTPTPQPQPVDQLNQLRHQIEARYGVKVFYTANEVQAYRPQGRAVTPLSDDKARAALNEINQVLSKYPAGFFQEFKTGGMPLSFYLIRGIVEGDSFSGLADFQFMNKPKITLVYRGLLFSMTAHHEIMHAIDSFMETKGFDPYTGYIRLNPTGFSYNTQFALESAKHTEEGRRHVFNFDPHPYFVSVYGKVNSREDRAEMFKFMMLDFNYRDWSQSPILNSKARLIARQIDANFNSAGARAHWTRFLK